MNLTKKVMSLSALLALGSISSPVLAQEAVMNTTAVQSELARGYVRPSLTVLYVTDGSSEANQVLSELQQLNTEQFYYNPVNLPTGKLNVEAKNDKELVEQLKSYAEKLLKENNVGQSVMHCWFPRFDEANKSYALDVLAERGAYGATDADVLAAEASKRGKDARLMELGERMIDRSYVQVVYLTSETHEQTVTNKIYSVLYKLDFGAEVRTNFYEKGYDSADGIDKVEFPLNFVASTKVVSFTKDKDVASAYDDFLTRMSQVNTDFQVQSPVLGVHPLQAKIGKKEGLKVDDRFYVMEMVQSADGIMKDKRRSTFRVTKNIADNRKKADGHGEEFTTFYQVAGGGYDKGMTLVSKKDIGTSVLPILSNNFVGAEIEQRVSKWTGIPGTFTFVRVGLPLGAKGIDGEKFGPVKFDYYDNGKKVPGSMLQWGIGARKEFNFARCLNFAAHASFNGYYLLISGDALSVGDRTIKKTPDVYTIAAGARLGMQVAPALGFFVGADYGYTLGEDKDLIKELEISPISASLGARISF